MTLFSIICKNNKAATTKKDKLNFMAPEIISLKKKVVSIYMVDKVGTVLPSLSGQELKQKTLEQYTYNYIK